MHAWPRPSDNTEAAPRWFPLLRGYRTGMRVTAQRVHRGGNAPWWTIRELTAGPVGFRCGCDRRIPPHDRRRRFIPLEPATAMCVLGWSRARA